MVWHFTEQLEQMSHGVMPQVFKSILALRRPASCLVCVVHLNRHVKQNVMWKVCLLKCASLIMVFPSISVSPLHPPTLFTPFTPSHEDPTSLGRDVLPLKLHGEFLTSPLGSMRLYPPPQQHHPPPLPLICFLVYFQHIPLSLCTHSFLRGEKIPKRSVSYFLILFMCPLLVVFFANPLICLCVCWAFAVRWYNTFCSSHCRPKVNDVFLCWF